MGLLVFVGFLGVDINGFYTSIAQFDHPTDKAVYLFSMHLTAFTTDIFAKKELYCMYRAFLDARGTAPTILGVLDIGLSLRVQFNERARAHIMTSPAADAFFFVNGYAHSFSVLLR